MSKAFLPGADESTQPLNVLYVNHVSDIGGAERSLVGLLDNLDPAVVAPTLALPPEGSLVDLANIRKWPVSSVSLGRMHRSLNPLALAAELAMLHRGGRELARLCRRRPPDIIHCNSLIATLAAGSAARRCPLIWHARDLRGPRAAFRRAARNAKVVIAISRAVADHIIGIAPQAAERVYVVYNGLDPAEVQVSRPVADIRRELGIGPDIPLLGFVGQPVQWKRLDLFLEAGALVLRKVKNLRLVVIGGDPFGDQSEQMQNFRAHAKRLGIDDRIVWTGYRSDSIELMAALDVLLHPAENEPLGRVVLEALALGVPCVAMDMAGPAEIIRNGESGLLTAPGDVRRMAAAVERILGDATLASTLREGGLRRSRDFTASTAARAVEEIYRQVLCRNRTYWWRWMR